MNSQRSITLRSPGSKEIVYLEYDPLHLPPLPSSAYTRFVCISDTHCRPFHVPDGDVLLHSGDITNKGTELEFESTMKWIYGLKHKVKIIIAGNHDLTLHAGWYEKNLGRHHTPQRRSVILDMLKGPKARAANVVYLEDEEYTFQAKEGGRQWSVYGSPWSPEFFNWAFGYTAEEGPALISKFPVTDILMTHGPPYDLFDRTQHGDLAGCPSLAAALPRLRSRLHLFGHIHEAHGAHIHQWSSGSAGRVQNSDAPEIHEKHGEAHYSRDEKDSISEAKSVVNPDDKAVTVFVNAANWPMGRRKAEFQHRGQSEFGGPGFRPVVVDMMD